MAAAKRISQETFDEVVKENVDEFEMSEKEALEEAMKQFASQGVSLANIDTSGGVGREEMLAELARLRDETGHNLIGPLKALSTLCDAAHPMGARNRMLFVTHAGSLNALHSLVNASQAAEVLLEAIKLLKTISKNNVEARDFFEPDGSKNLVGIMNSPEHAANIQLLSAALDLARCVAKTENNKLQLVKKGMGEVLVRVITQNIAQQTVFSSASEEVADAGTALLLQNACLVLRGLCIHDDLRRDMSCAMDNGKFFVNAPQLVPGLLGLSGAFKAHPAVAGAALSAAKTLVTTEESVQVMAQHGAMELPRAVLGYPSAATSLVRHALGLTRNLCADDIRKDRLVTDGTLELIVAAVNDPERATDAILVEHGVACLAAMSLRSPSNSIRILATGAAEVMVRAMRRHTDKAAVQRQGCLAFRNMAARVPESRGAMLDAGAEEVLRGAGRHQAAVDEAYGALRDLGCEVQKVRITEDGRIEAAYEAFGSAGVATGGKLRFNPVYDETSALSERVQEEAHAPFEAPTLRPFDVPPAAAATANVGHDHSHQHEHAHGEGGGNCC